MNYLTKSISYRKGMVLFLSFLLVSRFAYAQDVKDLSSRIEKLERDTSVLQRQVYRERIDENNSTHSNQAAPSGEIPQDFADYLSTRLDSLEQTIKTLTNQIEELQFNNRNINERVNRLANDIDFRFKELENKTLSSSTVAAEDQKPSATETKTNVPKVSDKTDNSAKTESPAVVSANQDNPNVLYDEAYDYLKKSNYAAAETLLVQFMSKYADHELASNAQYWLGETYYVRGDFERAAVAFAKGYEKYKKGSKGADNLLKLGLSMGSLGKKKEACVAFSSINKEYPDAFETIKKRAETEKKKFSCK